MHRWRPGEALLAPDVVVVEDDPDLSVMLQFSVVFITSSPCPRASRACTPRRPPAGSAVRPARAGLSLQVHHQPFDTP
ncbi:MAG: hypothetical protein ACYC3Q_07650 [Gemmatimonadaceae bacterium]